MDFDFFKLETEFLEQKRAEAQAEREHKAALHSIAEALFNSAVHYANERTPFKDGGISEEGVALLNKPYKLVIKVVDADKYVVQRLNNNPSIRSTDPSAEMNRRDTMLRIISFVRDQE